MINFDLLTQAEVLISVKTYPLPSHKYDELVCTAGFLKNGSWIRIYPVPFRALPYGEQYQKWCWITVDLKRNTSDPRPESYRPASEIKIGDTIPTTNKWQLRKNYALHMVYDSMTDLLNHKNNKNTSLATIQPQEIIDFIVEPDERDWKPQWKAQLAQTSIFDMTPDGIAQERNVVKKLPYKFYYRFITKGDQKPRKLMIEDWELGALYWNCLHSSNGDEQMAIQKVREKYFDQFLSQKDVYLFLGTTLQFHNIAPNPFIIIGVFYPPKDHQIPMDLF